MTALSVTATVTDAAGNQASATATATINDPAELGSSLGAYLAQPGGVLVMADGDYTISDFTQSGSLRSDWLTLVAQTPGGVKVKPRDGGDLNIEHVGYWTHLNKVRFIGVDFTDVRLNLHGCEDIRFWYPTDWSYPNAAYPGPFPVTNSDKCPTNVLFTAGGSPWRYSKRCGIYGGNLSAAVDNVDFKKCDDVEVVGCILTPLGTPHAIWHDDATQLSGLCTGISIEDSWVKGRNFWKIEPEFNTVDCDITIKDSWVSGSFGVGFHLGVKEDATYPNPTARLTVNRVNVRSWGHSGSDTLEGDNNTHPELTIVNDTNYSTVPGTGTDPATLWRQTHPYDSWREYFGVP